MTTFNARTFRFPGGVLRAASLGLALQVVAFQACGLKEAPAPELFGPAELGLGIRLTASPDIVLANGFATSVIQARLQDNNGQPLGGRELVFTVADSSGRAADVGTFKAPPSLSDLGTSFTARTDNNGIAQVVYEAPSRSDFTGDGSVTVQVRPVGSDANGAIYREVRIELRSTEPHLFAGAPTCTGAAVPGCNLPPSCNFATQAPNDFKVNTGILFQSTSSDVDGTIVRYEWFFTDGTQDDKPDINHVFRSTGAFTVTHVVTDNNGAQTACAATVNIR